MNASHNASHPASAPVLLNEDQGGGVRLLTFNTPTKRNALSEAMLAALSQTLASLAEDRACRAVVLAANGPVFCAGHDLKEMTAARAHADRGRAYYAEILGRCAAMMQAIIALPQPVIVAVEGTATAAGAQLVATCDLAVASETAQFCTPGVHIGLFCSTPMVALTRNMARKHAMEMLLLGELIPAMEAARMGLVNRVVAPGTALEGALALARTIASKSTHTVRIGKKAFYQQAEMPLAQAYAHAAEVMVDNMLARDAEEGIGAFVEKRHPVWEDR